MLWASGIILSKWLPNVLDKLPELKIGSYDDTFHDDDVFNYNKGLHEEFEDFTKRYKTNVLGGEISYNGDTRKEAIKDNKNDFINRTEKYRTSYLFYSGGGDYNTDSELLKYSQKMGYKLEINSITINNKDKTTVFQISNIGVAPLYKDAHIYINNTKSNESLKYLENGHSMTVTVKNVPYENAQNEISIRSEWCIDN